ncbi:MAG: hypothetical protein LBN07_04635, partial [Christensenellaceae bacterium]|nr:hypothetical protein [Christensenellaceae bacterium]
MKKVTMISVVVIYIISIVLVGYFGMAFTSYNPTIYATSIEITSNHNVQLGGEITKIIKLSSGEDRYELTWRVL